MEVMNVILSSPRTVFTMQGLAMLNDNVSRESLRRSLNYYAKKGSIVNPRKGIYTKNGVRASQTSIYIFGVRTFTCWGNLPVLVGYYVCELSESHY